MGVISISQLFGKSAANTHFDHLGTALNLAAQYEAIGKRGIGSGTDKEVKAYHRSRTEVAYKALLSFAQVPGQEARTIEFASNALCWPCSDDQKKAVVAIVEKALPKLSLEEVNSCGLGGSLAHIRRLAGESLSEPMRAYSAYLDALVESKSMITEDALRAACAAHNLKSFLKAGQVAQVAGVIRRGLAAAEGAIEAPHHLAINLSTQIYDFTRDKGFKAHAAYILAVASYMKDTEVGPRIEAALALRGDLKPEQISRLEALQIGDPGI